MASIFDTPLSELEKATNFDPAFPCIYCDEPVGSLSMGGAAICPSCDCGRNRDGTRWDIPTTMARIAHAKRRLARGGPTVDDPLRPYCEPDGSCCDFCCGN